MIVLDTNVISAAMKPQANPVVRAWLNEQVAETLYLTSVTLAEMLFGIAVLPAGRRRNSLTRALDGLLELFGDRVLPSTPTRHATTPRSPSRRATPVAASRRRMDTSLRSPPRMALSSRHATRHPIRPAGSALSTRGKADPAALQDPRSERHAHQPSGTPIDFSRTCAPVDGRLSPAS
jgi:predicted nucleic acid-binding protein